MQGRKELEVSFFQTLVLLLFNGNDALPYTRIKELTGVGELTLLPPLLLLLPLLLDASARPTCIDPPRRVAGLCIGAEDGELRRTLQSLALGKARVLRKEPKGKEVGDADVFTWNNAFTDPLIRIKVNTIQAKETKAEVDATHEAVQENRQYQASARAQPMQAHVRARPRSAMTCRTVHCSRCRSTRRSCAS